MTVDLDALEQAARSAEIFGETMPVPISAILALIEQHRAMLAERDAYRAEADALRIARDEAEAQADAARRAALEAAAQVVDAMGPQSADIYSTAIRALSEGRSDA